MKYVYCDCAGSKAAKTKPNIVTSTSDCNISNENDALNDLSLSGIWKAHVPICKGMRNIYD